MVSIDGYTIANDGTVEFLKDQRISAEYIFTRRQLGESVKCTIFRQGKLQEVEIVLKKMKWMVPLILEKKKPSYYVWGSMVFMPLTQNFISTWGSQVPPDLLERILTDVDTSEQRSELVIIYTIYSDEVTVGYNGWGSVVVSSINGENIISLKDLATKLDAMDKGLVTFKLENKAQSIIAVDAEAMKAATPRILRRYGIPADRSLD